MTHRITTSTLGSKYYTWLKRFAADNWCTMRQVIEQALELYMQAETEKSLTSPSWK